MVRILNSESQIPLKKTLTIKRVIQQARDIRSFDMFIEAAAGIEGGDENARLAFRPGQVAMLRVRHEEPAYFAFASAPDDSELEFLVKRTVGASTVIYDMKEGDRVDLIDVVGQGFDLQARRGSDLVFVAMGTGVAPLRSALRQVLKRPDDFGQLVVLYGVRTPDHFCYRNETDVWEAAGVELRQVISRPDGHDWYGPTGYVQSLLDHVLPDLSSPVALICGSREMITQTQDRLQQMGFAPGSILTNY